MWMIRFSVDGGNWMLYGDDYRRRPASKELSQIKTFLECWYGDVVKLSIRKVKAF